MRRNVLSFLFVFFLCIFTETLSFRITVEKAPAIKGGPIETYDHASVHYNHRLYVFGIPGSSALHLPVRYLNTSDPSEGWKTIEWYLKARPSARDLHTATLVGNKIFIFGGHHSRGQSKAILNDLFLFSPDFSHERRTINEIGAPGPRYGHTATAVGSKLVIFGGTDDIIYFNDIHTFQTDTKQWQRLADTNAPGPRSRHTATYVASLDKIYVLGGHDGQGPVSPDDFVHVFDINTGRWERMSAVQSGTFPEPRFGHSASLIGDSHILVIGGQASSDTILEDSWLFHIPSGLWTKVPLEPVNAESRLGPISRHTAVVDQHNVVYLVGGKTTKNFLRNNANLYIIVIEGISTPTPGLRTPSHEYVPINIAVQEQIAHDIPQTQPVVPPPAPVHQEPPKAPTACEDPWNNARLEQVLLRSTLRTEEESLLKKSLHENVATTEHLLQGLTQEVVAKEDLIDSLISALQRQKNSLSELYGEASQSVSGIKGLLDLQPSQTQEALQSKIASIHQEISVLDGDSKRVESEFEDVRKRLAEISLSSRRSRLDELEKKIADAEASVLSTTNEETLLRSSRNKAEIQKRDAEDTFNVQVNSCDAIKAKIDALEARLAELAILRARTAQDLKDIDTAIIKQKNIGASLDRKQSMITNLESTLNTDEQKISDLLINLLELEREAKEEILEEDLHDPSADTMNSFGVLKKNLDRLKSSLVVKLENHRTELIRLELRKTLLAQEAADQQHQEELLRKELDQLRRDYENCLGTLGLNRENLERTRAYIIQEEDRIARNLAKKNEFQALVEDLRKQLTQHEEERRFEETNFGQLDNRRKELALSCERINREATSKLVLLESTYAELASLYDLGVADAQRHLLLAREKVDLLSKSVSSPLLRDPTLVKELGQCQDCSASLVCPPTPSCESCPACKTFDKDGPCAKEKRQIAEYSKIIDDLESRIRSSNF